MKTGKNTIIHTAAVAIITAILLVPSAYAGSRGGHNGVGDRGHNEHRQERSHGNGHQNGHRNRGHGYERHSARHYQHNNYAVYGHARYRHTVALPFPPLPPIPFFSVRVH